MTKKECIVYTPDTSKCLEYYVDADFTGSWMQADANDADNVMSQNVMVIMYDNCLIFCHSSLQT